MATTIPITEHDALMAALLGNVGKVHDEIKRLPATLNGSVTPTLNALNKTMVDAQASLKAYAKGMEAPIKIAATEQLALTRKAFDETANATLAAVALDLKKATDLHLQATSESKGTGWRNISLILAAAAVAGLAGAGMALGAYQLRLDSRIEDYAAHIEENALALRVGQAFIALDDQGGVDQKMLDKIRAAIREQDICRKAKTKGR